MQAAPQTRVTAMAFDSGSLQLHALHLLRALRWHLHDVLVRFPEVRCLALPACLPALVDSVH